MSSFLGAAAVLVLLILFYVMMWLRERYARARLERMQAEVDLLVRQQEANLDRIRRAGAGRLR